MCILNQPRESLWTWPSSVVQLPSCSEALQQDRSPRDEGSMQRLACLEKRCVTLESLEMVSWPLNWKAQITGKCSCYRKRAKGLSFSRLLEQVPDPHLPHWVLEASHKVLSPSFCLLITLHWERGECGVWFGSWLQHLLALWLQASH